MKKKPNRETNRNLISWWGAFKPISKGGIIIHAWTTSNHFYARL